MPAPKFSKFLQGVAVTASTALPAQSLPYWPHEQPGLLGNAPSRASLQGDAAENGPPLRESGSHLSTASTSNPLHSASYSPSWSRGNNGGYDDEVAGGNESRDFGQPASDYDSPWASTRLDEAAATTPPHQSSTGSTSRGAGLHKHIMQPVHSLDGSTSAGTAAAAGSGGGGSRCWPGLGDRGAMDRFERSVSLVQNPRDRKLRIDPKVFSAPLPPPMLPPPPLPLSTTGARSRPPQWF